MILAKYGFFGVRKGEKTKSRKKSEDSVSQWKIWKPKWKILTSEKKRKSKKMYWQWFGERHPISKVTEEQVNLLGFDTGAHGLSEHYKH